ncbi:hypothetical protein CKAN_01194500 [Cinnamomum micranthum f. kanehirae]|uniref:Uncharacterized protein n=1 Tax=Cinnamomum micranthum f. kanehirae TaxID=337451 RepID=A0A3S3NNC1_9MAGN|nr:hypothetical protein CKAN_01194500 [Cinnamomum micranthum f. kanehirae]
MARDWSPPPMWPPWIKTKEGIAAGTAAAKKQRPSNILKSDSILLILYYIFSTFNAPQERERKKERKKERKLNSCIPIGGRRYSKGYFHI